MACSGTTSLPSHSRPSLEIESVALKGRVFDILGEVFEDMRLKDLLLEALKDDGDAGQDVRLNLENVRRTLADLEGRLEHSKRELQAMRQVVNGTPIVLGAALIVPAGWLKQQRGDEPIETFAADAAARARIERLAMDAVRQTEEANGCTVVDVSAAKCGWDLTSYPPARDGQQPEPRHIEVKGRVKGASTVTVSRNEILYAFNQHA